MTEDHDDDDVADPMVDLARLKPTVERLRGLLQAAAAAEEAAGSVDSPVADRTLDQPDDDSFLGNSADEAKPSPTSST